MSKKVIILFPGQGSQYVGMGSELGENKFLTQTNNVLNYDLKKIMLEGPLEDLTLTSNTQPAITSYSIALWDKVSDILKQKNVTPYAILGHSVGEYAALVAAGSLKFNDAISTVHARGTFMQEAAPKGLGTMYAILKVPENIVRKVCLQASGNSNCDNSDEKEIVSPANFNDPNQIVISGHKVACERAVQILKDTYSDPYRAIELKVSAPFHCSLMKPASEKMQVVLDNIKISNNSLSYVANIDAKLYEKNTSSETIKNNLIKQIEGSVLWTQSISNLPKDALYLEVGPGKILSGLVKKIIGRDANVINFNKSQNFETLMEQL